MEPTISNFAIDPWLEQLYMENTYPNEAWPHDEPFPFDIELVRFYRELRW